MKAERKKKKENHGKNNMRRQTILILLSAIVWCPGFSQAGWWTWMKGTYPGTAVPSYGTVGVPAASNEPAGEYQVAGCWVDSKGILWQYGGGNTRHSALWKYDPATNQWTWMSGPNGINLPGVWGTKGVPNAANYPPALNIGFVTWVDNQDNLWLFGGMGWGFPAAAFPGNLGALWKYDPITNMWTWVSGSSAINPAPVYGTQGIPSVANQPPARVETNAAWTDAAGNLWMFGGQGQTGEMNDLWKYNIATNQWTWMKGSNTGGSAGSYGAKGVAAASNNPPARQVHSRWTDNSGNFWFFGGTHVSNITYMNDMWKYDPATNNWTWMSGTNLFNQTPALPATCVPSTTNYPEARRENNSNWKDACGNFWMFSGDLTSGNNVNDLWCYKVQTNQWVLVSANVVASGGTQGVPAAANMPEATIGYAAWTRNNEFWMYGGRRSYQGGTESNTLWRYYPDTTCAQSTCLVVNPNAGFNGTNLSGCAPLTVTFTNTSTGATSWNWNFGDGGTSTNQNPVHTYTAAGTYTVTQIAYNLPKSDTLVQPNYITVIASPVLSIASQTNVTCNGASTGAAAVAATGGSTPYTYSWSNGQSTSGISNLAAGNYSVVVTNAVGCSSTQTVAITQPPPFAAAVTNTPAACNSNDGTATVSASGGSGSFTYQWSSGQTSQTITGLAAGNYSVTITDSNGCTQSGSTTILNSNGPTAIASGSTSIQSGNSATISASGGVTYSWSPATGLSNSTISNPTASPSATTIYCVYVFDANGCSDSSCVTITVLAEPIDCGTFYLPNAFSPNDDNENEVFKAYVNPVCVTEFKLVIYNRWGEKVFETEDVTKYWDGYFRGVVSNTAVYAYYCKATFTNGNKIDKKGNVSLVR